VANGSRKEAGKNSWKSEVSKGGRYVEKRVNRKKKSKFANRSNGTRFHAQSPLPLSTEPHHQPMTSGAIKSVRNRLKPGLHLKSRQAGPGDPFRRNHHGVGASKKRRWKRIPERAPKQAANDHSQEERLSMTIDPLASKREKAAFNPVIKSPFSPVVGPA
jgi:hypothetical protein